MSSTDAAPDAVEEATHDAALEKAYAEVEPLIKDGTISWSQLADRLAPEIAPIRKPEKVPLPAKINTTVQAAIKKLPAVFGKVEIEEYRALKPEEVTSLIEERQTIDAILKTLASRKEDIRTLALNHFDVQFEADFCCASDNDGFICIKPKGHGEEDGSECMFEFVPRNSEGHYAPRAEGEKWTDPGDNATGHQFSWERKENTKSSISPSMLKALADDENEPYITHADYLSMTRQDRVFDENKAMLAIRKKPRLLLAIAKATSAGSVSAQFWIRKASGR